MDECYKNGVKQKKIKGKIARTEIVEFITDCDCPA
jgi:hypothetical protein